MSQPPSEPPHSIPAGRRRIFKLLTVVLILASCVAIDLLAGWMFIPREQARFRSIHPYYHHGLLPNQERMTKWGKREYAMITNSLGMRDRSRRNVPNTGSRPRVVLLGDSMIEGLGVSYDASMAGVLDERWPDIEVLNASAVSFSPKLYYLKTRHLIERVGVKFDHLVVFIDISDAQDEVNYESFEPSHESAVWERFRAFGSRRSMTWHAIAGYTDPSRRINNAFRTDADVDVWMGGTRSYEQGATAAERGRWEWTLRDDVYEAWGRRGLELGRENMQRLVELCGRHGIGVTVVVYPAPYQILNDDLDSRQVQFWRTFCAEAGTGFADLFPLFIDYRYAGPLDVLHRYWIHGDTHWNEAGNTLVAEELDRRLRPLMPRGE